MSKRIYITHCSAKKDESLSKTKRKVTPDVLYTSSRIQRFMRDCKERNVNWAIFSDNYGICFSNSKNSWYEKGPDSVTDDEYYNLVTDFKTKLGDFDEIWFYYNPGRFHKLYRRLLQESQIRTKIKFFTHLSDIKKEQK